MSPHEGTQHEEIRTTEKTMSSLSPYEAIQAVIDKFKSANEPIPASLLSSLSHLKIKDPYSEYTRTKSSKSHSPPSASQSKSTKGLLGPTTSQSKSAKGWSPPSTSQSKTTKGLSPSQSSAAVISHVVTPPAPIHKPKGRSLSPKLAFSSGLFSSDAAKRNKIIVDLPNSDNSRENYILNEYDCRMKKHITFQAVTFELLNTKKGLHKVSNLIHQQRRFEERWPSRYSETSPSEEFYDESVFDTNIEEIRETDMTEMIQESKQPIRMLQHLLNSVDSIKRR